MQNYVLGIVGLLFTLGVAASPLRADPLDTVRRANAHFRSSDRDIDALVLMEEGFEALGPELVLALRALNQDQLRLALDRLRDELQINQGVAENFFKLHQIALLCKLGYCPNEYRRDTVKGLGRVQLDALVQSFPKITAFQEHEFNYRQYEKERLTIKYALENDWYNFRVAAAFFERGMHISHTSTYQAFSRGTTHRAYFVANGMNRIYDMLTHLRFTEREITYLREHPQYRDISPSFWEYLRGWKFTGSIRAVREGTVLFANEPIMEVTANPIDHHLIEVLLLPLLNDAGKSSTKMARIATAMDGRDVVEGGMRRSGNGRLSSLYAIAAGALGTSNTHICRLFKDEITPYGSMPHAWVDHFDSELDAFLAYLNVYPDSSVIGDTHDIIQGIKHAIRAGGSQLAGIREDSLLPQKNLEMTVKTVRYLLNYFGYEAVKLGISNRLDEYELRNHPTHRAPFQWALVGSEIAAPSDAPGLNVVYKLGRIEIHRPGQPPVFRDMAKTSEGKPGLPGTLQTYRFYNESGIFTHDVLAGKDEAVSGPGRPLLFDTMTTGRRLFPDEPLAETAALTRSTLAQMPTEVLDLQAEKGIYPVHHSREVTARMAKIKRRIAPDRRMRIGVFFGSFDPPTDAHRLTAARMRELYNMEQMICVPTGDNSVTGKKYQFAGDTRASMLEHSMAEEEGISVSRIETEGRTQYSIDTLRLLAEENGWPSDAEIIIVGGEDLFETVPTWKEADTLITRYSWAIASRGGTGVLPVSLLQQYGYETRMDSPRHMVHRETGKIIELVDVKSGALSATKAREAMAAVDTIFHQVDTMETFWEGMHGLPAGSLAVPGSAALTPRIELLAWLARYSPRVKAVASIDYHFESELREPRRWNPEFLKFPAHGMAERTGPQGHGRIREVRDLFALSRQLRIPNLREKKGATPDQDTLEEVPFDLESHAAAILDPEVELIIEKNGVRTETIDGHEVPVEAYDWAVNRNAVDVLKRTQAKRVVVYGVATEWCDEAAVMRYLRMGFEVWVVEDAIVAIHQKPGDQPISQERNGDAAIERMKGAGARFVTTQQVLEEYGSSLPTQFAKEPGCPSQLAALASSSAA